MLLPEFYEELFYVKEINLFESTFKIYLEKIRDYSFLETRSFLKRLNRNYTIEELKNLQRLYLYNSQLTSIPKLTLLPNLRILDLQNNQLTSFPNLNFPNLRELWLDYNKLTSFPMLHLPNLTHLMLTVNELTELPNLNLPNLKELFLTSNQFTSIPKLTFVPNLQRLWINDNPLIEVDISIYKNLQSFLY